MIHQLQRLARSRFRISYQLYAAIGGAVVLTIAASIVGWFSFDRVGDAQGRINEGTIPEIAAAFGVARHAGALVAAGPGVTAAATPEDFAIVSTSIDESHGEFEEQLKALEQTRGDDVRFQVIRSHADSLINNVEEITADKTALFELREKSEATRAELEEVRNCLDRVVVSGLDNQLFYIVTGYRELGQPPALQSEHFSEAEFGRYRYLSDMQVDGNIATQLLASAFSLSDPSGIEPLRERFEAAKGRIERSLTAVESTPMSAEATDRLFELCTLLTVEGAPPSSEGPPIYRRLFGKLFELALGEDTGFNLLDQELRLVQRQRVLLELNRDFASALGIEVDDLVVAAQANAQQATDSSAQAIFTGRTLLLGISAISIGGALLIAYLFVGRVILSRLQLLSGWMRRMAGGDLESQVEIDGQDEIADMAAALEVFRQHALEVQRLNLVEKMAEELQDKNDELESVLADLRRAQDQIIMREKLAALGELTAGVAHEIRNPLNFVKNFSESSEDLLAELKETLDETADKISEEHQALVEDISGELVSNMERIRSHGERADRIVRDMLMMGSGSGVQQPTDLNRLIDQNARLAFHSARALNSDFQLEIEQDLDPEVGEVPVVPQDLGRVFLNMVANACDATNEKRLAIGDDGSYGPTVWLTTRRGEEEITISIKDNGSGMPPEVVEKIFNPFFTTKPTDKGTGLGLSISNDIIRQHGGAIRVESQPGEFTEMIIQIPSEPVMSLNGDADQVDVEEEAEPADAS